MYPNTVRRPSNVYHIRRSATDLHGMYRSPSGGYYGPPEMSMVPPPLSPHFSAQPMVQPMAQPAMTWNGHRVLRRNPNHTYSGSCCDSHCCERCCDECCENYCDRCCYEYCCCRRQCCCGSGCCGSGCC